MCGRIEHKETKPLDSNPEEQDVARSTLSLCPTSPTCWLIIVKFRPPFRLAADRSSLACIVSDGSA
jgi:hypothetical protein